MIKRYELPPTELKKLLRYDPTTGNCIWLIGKRRGTVAGKLLPAGKRRRPSWAIRINNRHFRRSRIAWCLMTGNWPSAEIDHRDLDTLNDRWSNLREATRYQQEMNKSKYRNNTSGFKGVSFRLSRKGIKRFEAQIMRNYVLRYLGTFDTAEEAHAAYVQAARETDGDFLRVN